MILAAWQRARREGETLVVAGIERPDDPGAGVRYTGRLPPDEYRALQRRAAELTEWLDGVRVSPRFPACSPAPR